MHAVRLGVLIKLIQLTANVCEVFSSIQGEGIFVGCRHLFLRLAGCNLRCEYCDTKDSWLSPDRALFQEKPNSYKMEGINNPISLMKLWDIINRFHPKLHHSLSITGGEPLMQVDTVKALSKLWKDAGGKVLLETNGTLPDKLEEVLHYISYVSMDIKLGNKDISSLWTKHAQFLKLTNKSKASVYIKLVINASVSYEDINKVLTLVSNVNSTMPVILQPEYKDDNIIISMSQLLEIQWMMLKELRDVRILPQLHKLIGVK